MKVKKLRGASSLVTFYTLFFKSNQFIQH